MVLFELCAGGSPFRKEASIVGMAERAGGRTTASGPAQVVSAESARLRGTSVARLRKQLTGDLASICAKSLAFAPEDRYMTVAELASDIRRYLAGQPVEAHAAGYAYRARKFVTRYAGQLALAALVILGLTGAALYSRKQAQQASKAAERAEATNLFLTSILSFRSQAEHDSNVTLASVLELAEGRVAGIRAQDPVLASDIELSFAMAIPPEDKRGRVSVANALELARAAGDASREASALAVLGYKSYLDNRPDDAWEHLSQSMELWQRNRSSFSPIRAVFILGVAGKSMTHVRPYDHSPRAPLTECLDLARNNRVPDYLRLACLEGLATSLLFGSQDYQTALPLLEETVALRRKEQAVGPLAEALQLLGLNYRFLGRYREDELAQRESYLLVLQKLRPGTLWVANQRSVWATALAGAGQPEEGLRQAEAALAIYRRQYPEPGALLLWTPLSAAMANSCLLNGYVAACERYAREALQTLGANPSPRDTRLATAQGYLGLALAKREDRRAEAKPLLESALKMLREQNRNPIHRQAMEAALLKLR
jgi:serine/threonine-protein kinase